MIPHEGGDEVVAVIVQRLHAHGHGVPHARSSRGEQLRLQLVVQEAVG